MAQWAIDDEITADKLNKNRAFPSKVRVYLDSNQNLPTTTFTTIEFDKETYDISSEFSIVTHKFTALKAGYYSVQGSVEFYKVGVDVEDVEIWITGAGETSKAKNSIPGGNHYTTVVFADTFLLGIGDTIEIQAYTDGGGTVTLFGGSADTHLEIREVYES